ncbi:MAG: hypothetical protein ACU836_08680 [Gammaproteobacteria bacterium]
MNINPEFQRQLYLECSQSQLTGVPLALGALFTLGYFIDGHQLGSITAKAALTLFLFITLLWGARKTLNSIVEEYRDRTWDIQRLSALGPWEMTWGKLLGSTIIVWYAGIICLLTYSAASVSSSNLGLFWFYGIVTGLLLQSSSLLLGLLAVHRGQNKGDSSFLITVVVFFLLAPWLMDTAGYSGELSISHWYSIRLDSTSVRQIELLAGLFWCMVGCYRMMAQALGLRTLPWVWLSFLAFLVVFLGGFLSGSSYSFSFIILLVCSVLTYVGVLFERNDAIRIKHFVSYFLQRNWRRAGEEIPIWWLSLLATIPPAASLAFSNDPIQQLSTRFHFYPLAIVLILLRDCAIYLFFLYGKKPQKALNMTLLAGVFLYGILPGLFSFFGINSVSSLAFPLLADTSGNALLCAALQTAVILKLLYHRWRSNI